MAKKMQNPFKAFTAFKVNGETNVCPFVAIKDGLTSVALDNVDDLEQWLTHDPSGSEWATRGLVPATTEGDYFHDLDGAGYLFALQFNERILPGKVIQERVNKLAEALQEREGRKLGRKEFAELRDEVEQQLLPTAFIRRSTVYGLFTPDHRMYLFTGSVRKTDEMLAFIVGMFSNMECPFGAQSYNIENMVGVLTGIALAGSSDLVATDKGVFKGDGTETIRVKDKDFSSTDVQAILKQGYRVHELGMALLDEFSEPNISFVLTKALYFKGVAMSDTKTVDVESSSDFHGLAWLVAKEYGHLFNQVLAAVEHATGEDEEL